MAVPADYSCSAFSLCHRLLEHDSLCHATGVEGRENFVRTSRELHQLILRGALKQSSLKRPFELGNLDVSPPPYKEVAAIEGSSNAFRILGREFGEVAYVSPPLSALFMDNVTVRVPAAMLNSFGRTGLAAEDVEDSRMTKQIVTALGRIWGGREQNDHNPTDEQVVPGMRMIELDDSSSRSIVVHGFENLMRFASEFLRTATFLRNTRNFEPSVMVMITHGRDTDIGFAPVGTQLGDVTCAYKDTDVVSVVRRAVDLYSMIGEASLLRGLEAPSELSFTGQPIVVKTDMLSVQIFSRIPPVCDLPDYRAVLKIAPGATKLKMQFLPPFRGIHRLTEVLSTPSGRRQMDTRPMSTIHDSGSTSRSNELEAITEIRTGAQVVRSAPTKRACPRCKVIFSTTRDKLRHAATWSHQQCGKCERWTSWPAPNASNSKTLFCTICRSEDPGCAMNTPPLLEESEWKSPWWTTDSPTSERNSMSDSENWSQIATSGSDKQSRNLDEMEMVMLQGRRSYHHTRSHVCDQNCPLSRGNSKGKEVDKGSPDRHS